MRALSFEWIIPVLIGGGLLYWHDGWVSPSFLIYSILLGFFLAFLPRRWLSGVVYVLGFPLIPLSVLLAVFASIHLSTGPISVAAPAFRDGNVSLAAAVVLYAVHLLFFGTAAVAYVSILLVKRHLSPRRTI